MKRVAFFVSGVVVLAFAFIAVAGALNKLAREQAKQDERRANFPLVPVAAKDIPIGTKIRLEEANDLFVYRHFPKDAVPPNAVLTLEDLTGKRTMRTIRQGELVQAMDVDGRDHMAPPGDALLMTVPVAASQRESGFLLPGCKVIVLAAKKSEAKGKEVVIPLLIDALILGVDESKPGVDQFQVSFAVTPEQSLWLAAAVDRGATIRVELPVHSDRASHETDTRIVLPLAQSLDDLRAFLENE